jgi:hypothetical protein
MSVLRCLALALLLLVLWPATAFAATGLPPGGQYTSRGQTVTASCPTDHQVTSAIATYYKKNGKVVATSTNPQFIDPNFRGEFTAVTFVTPKGADYVVIGVQCRQASVLLTGTENIDDIFSGNNTFIIQCPAGTQASVQSYTAILLYTGNPSVSIDSLFVEGDRVRVVNAYAYNLLFTYEVLCIAP